MKIKSIYSICLLSCFWLLLMTSCGKKEHEINLTVPADTVSTTVIITEIEQVYVTTELESDVFINLNEEEIKNLVISLDENAPNGMELITFTNTDIHYSLISGDGFSLLNNTLLVSDNAYLDYEIEKELRVTLEGNNGTDIKRFEVLILLNDLVDISDLKAHFTFDNQTLTDEVSGEDMTLLGNISYVLNNHEGGNYYIDFVANVNNKVLEWDAAPIGLNQDFSICFFGLLRQEASNPKETIIAGYNASEEEVITVFFENGMLKVGLNGVVSNLNYSVFNSGSNNIVKTALIRSGNTLSLRVNNNDVSEMVYSETLTEVTHWSFGGEKSPSSNVSNAYNKTLDNLRFYQKAISLEEYLSIIATDY